MRIVAWNVGHQTQERPLKAVFAPAVQSLAPAILILNEFVDGDSRASMKAAFGHRGLQYVACSSRVGRHTRG
jgi:hypothetical protein